MTRIIKGLDINVWRSLEELLPRAATIDFTEPNTRTVDVLLSEAAILKVYSDEVIIDLGGEKVIFQDRDFKEITIG